MRRGWIEPPSARPVALRSSAFSSLRAALIKFGVPRARRLADQLGSSPRHPLRIGAWTPRTVQRAPRTGTGLSPGQCPEASREWVVTPPAGAAPAPPTAYLRMAAPRGRGGPRKARGVRAGINLRLIPSKGGTFRVCRWLFDWVRRHSPSNPNE